MSLELTDRPGADQSAGPTARAAAPSEGPGPLSLQKATSPVAVRTQVLTPGVRKDLRRIASGQPYRFLVVLAGEVQIRARDGSRLSLRPGLRLDCDLLRQDAFFAVFAEQAELLWIG